MILPWHSYNYCIKWKLILNQSIFLMPHLLSPHLAFFEALWKYSIVHLFGSLRPQGVVGRWSDVHRNRRLDWNLGQGRVWHYKINHRKSFQIPARNHGKGSTSTRVLGQNTIFMGTNAGSRYRTRTTHCNPWLSSAETWRKLTNTW